MIYIHVAAALVALAIGAGGAWKVQAWRWRAADAERMQADAESLRLRTRAADGAASRHEHTRAALQDQRQVLTQETDRAIAAAPDWHAAECFDADGLRGIADALGRTVDHPGQPAPALPSASAPQ